MTREQFKQLREAAKATKLAEADREQARRAALPACRFLVVFQDIPKGEKGREQTVESKPTEVIEWAKKQLALMGEDDNGRITAYPI